MAEWVDAAAVDELLASARRLVRTASLEIALFNVQGNYHAIEDSCPHAGSSLGAGKLDGTTVTCRAHGLRFDLTTGCMRGASGLRIRTSAVRLHEGRIQIDVERPAPEGA